MPRITLRRKPVRTMLSRRSESQMGGFFDSFDVKTFLNNPMEVIQQVTAPLEESIKTSAQTYLPESLYDRASSLISKTGESLEQKAEGAVKQFAATQVQKYASQPEVQEGAIRSGITAIADRVSETAIDVNRIFREGGFGAVFKKYPIPFYVTGGLVGLITLRFVLGRKILVKAK